VGRAAAADPWLRQHPPAVEWFSGQFAPAEVPLDLDLVRLLQGAHLAVTGAEPAVEAVTYGADMRHFLRFGDTPCLMYGAGDVRLAHHHDEHLPLDELLTATTTLAVAITDWCGVSDSDPIPAPS